MGTWGTLYNNAGDESFQIPETALYCVGYVLTVPNNGELEGQIPERELEKRLSRLREAASAQIAARSWHKEIIRRTNHTG